MWRIAAARSRCVWSPPFGELKYESERHLLQSYMKFDWFMEFRRQADLPAATFSHLQKNRQETLKIKLNLPHVYFPASFYFHQPLRCCSSDTD